ncbi:tetratricopeptide repeat protein [Flavihumibacter solisilvae]|uniref:Uncharacterized protein n=1 Tax=Flavihumibacter solisilvae TaxID=1349421 RepID=A0A0C1LDK9_9BACT|nr:tetratricopeptide repeat protein [Flavihumibacter solisilvae]KIC93538.1 hypothetical protein OI18_17470 [Flavihumibacter solisilvae]
MKKLLLALSVALVCLSNLSAQEKNPLINSGKIIEDGIKLHDEGKYKEAIDLYSKVNRSDTNYVYALYELALSYSADSQYQKGLQVVERAMAEKTDRERLPELLTQYGNLVDNLGDPQRALHIYDSALRIYPAYNMLYLNKGTTLMRLEKFKEAETAFQQCLLIDPYTASAHYKLGIVSIQQGLLVPSMLSFMSYLIISPEGQYSNTSITILNSIAKNTDEINGYVSNRTVEQAEEYSLPEQILQSKIALDKKYKPIIKLDDAISRQIQVVLEKLDFAEGSSDFWMQFYMPLYSKLFRSGKFEHLVNYMFSGVNLPEIKSYNKKNKKEIDALIEEIVAYLNKIRSTRELIFAKRDASEIYYHYSGGKFTGKGKTTNNNETFVGDWIFYYPGGNIKSKGRFDSKGELDGPWEYYFANGDLKVQVSYTNGKQNGNEVYYYQNGQVSSRAGYQNDNLEAEGTRYFYSGRTHVIANYGDGKLQGERKRFFSNGGLMSVESYANDRSNGNFKTYYKSGRKESEGTYVDGELSGFYKAWHENGTLATDGQYTKDKPTGTWKRFHDNGKLNTSQSYVDGTAEGLYEEYYDNGQLFSKYSYKKGSPDGEVKYFDEDGKMFSVFFFENGKLKTARYYDKSGKLISTSEAKGNKLSLTKFYPQGMQRTQVEYNGMGNAEGIQTDYFHSGKVSQTSEYHEGSLNGTSTGYYANGKVSSIVNYKDDKKHGYCKNYFEHGGIQSEGWYQDNVAEGPWLYYDELGNISAVSYFFNDELDGHKDEFYVNGQMEYDTKYTSGVMEEMTQYDTTGKVIHRVEMKKGSGKFSGVHLNGKTAFEGNYVQGQFEGLYRFYFFDGSPYVIQYYKKGELDSTYKNYYYGGQPGVEGQYQMGKKSGLWKYYNRQGKLTYSEEYIDGQLHGFATYYFDNGKTDLEVPYEKGLRHGFARKFDPSGNLAYQLRYKDDLQVGYSYLDKTGNLVPEVPILAGNGKLKSFYQNGSQAVENEFRDGKIHGLNKILFANGKTWYERVDAYGITDGPIREYYENGQLKSDHSFVNDVRHGPYKEYTEKGLLREEGTFYNGNYHGQVKIYDLNGKLKETHNYYHGKLLSVKK